MGGGVWAGGNHLCSCALSLAVRIVQPPRSPTAGRAVFAVVHRRPRRDGTGEKAGRSWAAIVVVAVRRKLRLRACTCKTALS